MLNKVILQFSLLKISTSWYFVYQMKYCIDLTNEWWKNNKSKALDTQGQIWHKSHFQWSYSDVTKQPIRHSHKKVRESVASPLKTKAKKKSKKDKRKTKKKSCELLAMRVSRHVLWWSDWQRPSGPRHHRGQVVCRRPGAQPEARSLRMVVRQMEGHWGQRQGQPRQQLPQLFPSGLGHSGHRCGSRSATILVSNLMIFSCFSCLCENDPNSVKRQHLCQFFGAMVLSRLFL